MERNFDWGFEMLIGVEGEYTNNPKDSGGKTIYGIASAFFPEDFKRIYSLYSSGKKDEALKEAKKFYKTKFWNKGGCNDLPSYIDVFHFINYVNLGSRATKILEKTKGELREIVALESDDEKLMLLYMINYMFVETVRTYSGLNKFNTFGRGWVNRAMKIRDEMVEEIKKNE
ncbi:MAG TPA: glycosyl hydrolase 108 family protein [Methanofastidiosum sp.]|nr:glycosyl hydrolase 108 family protein [Methanofastidiosum sp.]